MLEDIEETKKNMSKFKRGLSIFEDANLRQHLTSKTAAPILSDNNLSENLQKYLIGESQIGSGPNQSISQNISVNDYETYLGSPVDANIDLSLL